MDIARAASDIVSKPELYRMLEDIQGGHGQVSWGDVPPKVFVMGNLAPAVAKLSTDRLQVFKINGETLDVRRDTAFENELATQAAEFERLDAEKEAAIDKSPQIEQSDTKACFDMCYVRAAGTPTILSEKMHMVLRSRARYNQSKKAMNKWIRDYFRDDTESKDIEEKSHLHKVGWRGFRLKPV